MTKRFNTTGACSPVKHYMVDLTSRLEAIKAMVENGDYCCRFFRGCIARMQAFSAWDSGTASFIFRRA